MGVSNVNNLNKIDLTKLALAQKSRQAKSNQPAYMQMTGSIFNAPEVKQQQETTNLNTLNTKKSLNELTKKTSTSTKSSDKEDTKIDNASDGKAAAASAEKQASNVKSLTKDAENSEKIVNKFSTNSQKLSKDIKKGDKQFQAQLNKQEADFKKENDKLQKLTQETEETQTEIDNAQKELDSLLGSSTFTISMALKAVNQQTLIKVKSTNFKNSSVLNQTLFKTMANKFIHYKEVLQELLLE